MTRFAAPALVLSLLVCGSAFAFNYRDLRDAPIAWFNDDDIGMMTESFQNAMDNNADGTVSEWQNDATGNHGRITPLDTFQQDAATCRRARIENYAGSNHGVTELKFCRDENGTWQVSE